ncbi:MAG: biliverdin-producing heme oxygenase [Acidobacteria bacterium]|nr:biliverdin-producing heme oxygenase [Acidobacteriota bacterium]
MQPETANDSIMAQLKSRTAHQHQATEATVNLMRPDFTLDDYRELLKRFFAFYEPFEAKVQESLAENPIELDHSERLNTPRLLKDLKNLGYSDDEINAFERAETFPDLDSKENIFGSLYVIEGSTLGGQVIGRHLKQHFDLDASNGAAFFLGYGPDTGKMWRGYAEAVTKFAETADTEKIIAGANQTFEAIGKALSR